MTAHVIDGKAFAARVSARVAGHVARLTSKHGVAPGLAVILVGEDPASRVYVRSKRRATVEAGMKSVEHKLRVGTSETPLLNLVRDLNADPSIHGILVQLPLPNHLGEHPVIDAIDPARDVDGFHLVNAGLVCSPRSEGMKGHGPLHPAGLPDAAARTSRFAFRDERRAISTGYRISPGVALRYPTTSSMGGRNRQIASDKSCGHDAKEGSP